MKPQPFSSLNHFTLPTAISPPLPDSGRAAKRAALMRLGRRSFVSPSKVPVAVSGSCAVIGCYVTSAGGGGLSAVRLVRAGANVDAGLHEGQAVRHRRCNAADRFGLGTCAAGGESETL